MSELLSIGRFAAMTGLTQKALRLYDREGILKPAYMDFASGYRYYDPGQSEKARGIVALRSRAGTGLRWPIHLIPDSGQGMRRAARL